MSSEVSIVPSHRLRALNGPLRGATFNVLGHITIGRSCDADLQILQDGVSRQHAQVVAMPDGRHRLIDLSSSNGTFVDDRRITECVLEPGMVLRVGWTRLVYESASGAAEEIELRRVGGEGLRTLQTLELDAAAEEQDPPEGDAAGLDLLAPARSDRRGGDEHDRFMATLPDGSRYPGDLLDDVVTYRSLRTKKLRDDELEPEEEERFRALDDRMRPPPDRSGFRRYHRYGCRIPAFLRLLIGRTLPVVVENLGVDGAKVCVPWHRLATNTIAWLAIDVVRGREASILVFAGRVVWWEREHLGMSFSGSPGWARRGGRESLMPTLLETGRVMAPRTSLSTGHPMPTAASEAEEPTEHEAREIG